MNGLAGETQTIATTFQFRLQSLLNFRESQRDRVRGWLAQVLARDAQLVEKKEQALANRAAVLSELLALTQGPRLDVDHAAARRYHAGQLQVEAAMIDQQRAQLAEQIAVIRQALVKADQGVKVLEQLSEHQATEFWAAFERRESLEREEAWQSGRLAQAVTDHYAESAEIVRDNEESSQVLLAERSTPPSAHRPKD